MRIIRLNLERWNNRNNCSDHLKTHSRNYMKKKKKKEKRTEIKSAAAHISLIRLAPRHQLKSRLARTRGRRARDSAKNYDGDEIVTNRSTRGVILVPGRRETLLWSGKSGR